MHFTFTQGKYFSSWYADPNWVFFNPIGKKKYQVLHYTISLIYRLVITLPLVAVFRTILIRNSN